MNCAGLGPLVFKVANLISAMKNVVGRRTIFTENRSRVRMDEEKLI